MLYPHPSAFSISSFTAPISYCLSLASSHLRSLFTFLSVVTLVLYSQTKEARSHTDKHKYASFAFLGDLSQYNISICIHLPANFIFLLKKPQYNWKMLLLDISPVSSDIFEVFFPFPSQQKFLFIFQLFSYQHYLDEAQVREF